jgi:hypothetical protein
MEVEQKNKHVIARNEMTKQSRKINREKMKNNNSGLTPLSSAALRLLRLLRANALAMTNKKISRRDRMLVEISSQAKATCGAAANQYYLFHCFYFKKFYNSINFFNANLH